VKLAILGGGGFRVPMVYQALLADPGPLADTEVVLHDCDPQRLAVMESVLARLAGRSPDAPRVTAAGGLDAALEGADFVFSAIRVGGLAGRERDERIALDLGVLGQETTGPGGIAFGLRTIPVALHIAERVRQLCPGAYVINFTNPAGMITEAMQRVLGDRVIGICDTPSGLGRRITAALGLDPAEARFDYVGLNHLGWMRGVSSGGTDRLPGLLADDDKLATLEETDIFGADWIRTLGCIPNEYLYYYYFNRDAVAAIAAQDAPRGAFLTRQQNGFYYAAATAPQRALELWERTHAERRSLYMAEARSGGRGGPRPAGEPMPGADGQRSAGQQPGGAAEPVQPPEGGYSGVALGVMRAIGGGEPATMILNVRNGDVLAGLDADAVVELPAVVDSSGVHPLPTAAPNMSQLGLMQQVKAVERLTIEAATTGSADAALRAFALHPLVDSVTVARRLAAAYTVAMEAR
jgi:6-phospho-beta-glucosidase